MINTDKKIHIGILGAMPEEINSIIKKLDDVKTLRFGDLIVSTGVWYLSKTSYIFITAAWSGWGKVSASRAVTRLISSRINGLPIDLIIFTGVAGSASKNVSQWDVVIADKIYQHDFDARPLFDEFIIPAINKKYLSPKNFILKTIEKTINSQISNLNTPFKKIHIGSIATGDQFISSKEIVNSLSKRIDNLLALEMEGAAVAQVCFQEDIPWLVIRVISDNADEEASEKFEDFLNKYNNKSASLIGFLLKELGKKEFIKRIKSFQKINSE